MKHLVLTLILVIELHNVNKYIQKENEPIDIDLDILWITRYKI